LTRISFAIHGPAERERLAELAKTLAAGMRVDIKPERRSNAQNSKFWAMLGEVSEQVVWHGDKLSPEEWKYLFLDAYKREMRLVKAIDGKGYVRRILLRLSTFRWSRYRWPHPAAARS
jgi:hypothetical protein